MQNYEVDYYKDAKGKSDIFDAISEIANNAEKSKEASVLFTKITEHIHHLEYYGLTNNGNKIKKIKNTEIWELRPKSKRIMFFCVSKGKFVLLSIFTKKTQKTPDKEIKKAIRIMNNYLKLEGKNE